MHAGQTHGFSSYIARYPSERILIVILSNIENESVDQIGSKISEIVFDCDRHGKNLGSAD